MVVDFYSLSSARCHHYNHHDQWRGPEVGGAVSGDVTMKEQHLARVGETSQYTGVVSSPAV